jgi:hypothetical protein
MKFFRRLMMSSETVQTHVCANASPAPTKSAKIVNCIVNDCFMNISLSLRRKWRVVDLVATVATKTL